MTEAGEVVLLRRGIEPGRGLWAQPGGFMEIDETVHEGAIRETLEETGLVVEPGEVVGLYTRPEAAIVVIAFEARIVGGAPTATPEALEVRPFAPEAIPWPEIAFRTSVWALRDWVRRVRRRTWSPTRSGAIGDLATPARRVREAAAGPRSGASRSSAPGPPASVLGAPDARRRSPPAPARRRPSAAGRARASSTPASTSGSATRRTPTLRSVARSGRRAPGR